MEECAGIYRLVCTITNKVYVGSAFKCVARGKTHLRNLKNRKHVNIYLQNAWNKYGGETFIFEILEKCNRSELLTKEQDWVLYLKSCNAKFGFNIAYPVRQNVSSARMSARHKAYWENLSDTDKTSRISAMRAVLATLRSNEDYRNNLSIKALARWSNPKFRKKVQKAVDALWSDPNYRDKALKRRSVTAIKQWTDKGHHVAMSKKRADRWKEASYYEERVKGTKDLWLTKDYRDKVTSRIKASCNDPEYRKRLSERVTAYWAAKRAAKDTA